MLVGQRRVANHRGVWNGDIRLAHLQRLLELAVLECDLHWLLGDHHVVFAHSNVVQVAVRGRVELVDLQHLLDFLAGVRVGLRDTENPVAVVVALHQLQDALAQQGARERQVVQRHGQLLLAGELLGLDGDTGDLRALLTAHRLGHGHILQRLGGPVDDPIDAGGNRVTDPCSAS